jgi:hypothetical protein
MNFTGKLFSKAVLGATAALSIFMIGCGSSDSSQSCCQTPKLEAKVKQEEKVVPVPEVLGQNAVYDANTTPEKEIVYVDRNVTIIEYRDRNITVIHYVDRNVTVDVVKVRPEAEIKGLIDGAILKGDTLAIDGVDSSDTDGNVTSYKWLLDGVEISTLQNPTIELPSEEGNHMLCLTVTDNDNLTSKKTCKSFVIPHINLNPTAAVNVKANPNSKNGKIRTKCPLALSGATSIANDGTLASYEWTIDNNKTLQGKDQSVSFDTVGTHNVCLEVTDANGLKDKICRDVVVEGHEAPTPKIGVTDIQGGVMTKDSLFKRMNRYNLSCAGSKDDCGNEEPMTCEWNAHSYRLDSAGNKVNYIRDCFNDSEHEGHGPKVAKESYIVLCSSGIKKYKYIEIELKITDRFGKTNMETKVFEVAP